MDTETSIDRDKSTQVILNNLQKKLKERYRLEILRGIAKNLEIGIYNFVFSKDNTNPVNSYQRRFVNIVWNIKNNPLFIDKILSKEWSFEFISSLKSDELFIEEKNKIVDDMKRKIKESQDAEKEINNIKIDGAYTCGRCKSKNVTYRQLQKRAADEGYSNLMFCGDCDRRWVIS